MNSTPMIVTFCVVAFARLAAAAPVAIPPEVIIRQFALVSMEGSRDPYRCELNLSADSRKDRGRCCQHN